FVVNVRTGGSSSIWAIDSDGSVRQLAAARPLLGRERVRRRLLAGNYNSMVMSGIDGFIVDLNGNQTPVTTSVNNVGQGWITPNGGVYLEQQTNMGASTFLYYKEGAANSIATAFIGIPTADYTGAWI